MSFNDTFVLGGDVNQHQIEFKICPTLWVDGDFIEKIITTKDIKEIKYLNDSGTSFCEDIQTLPQNGGIYFFVIKSITLPQLANYLVYIGRAQKTENQNLRIRCKKYWQNYSRDDERPKIARMIKQYGQYLYLRYIDLGKDNDLIIDLEAKLINNLLPPFNDEIPSKKIREAVKAFL
jgi:hypothetical protein